MFMKKRKKGISTIIATILLVVIALALVVILLSWGSEFVTKNTKNVDDSVNKECIGSYVEFINCIYDKENKTLTATIVNTGSVDFQKDYNFNVILIDADKNISLDYTDVLNKNSFLKNASTSFTIEEYTGLPPITLQLRNTMCAQNYWETKCS